MPVDLQCKHNREIRARAADLFAVANMRPHMDAPHAPSAAKQACCPSNHARKSPCASHMPSGMP